MNICFVKSVVQLALWISLLILIGDPSPVNYTMAIIQGLILIYAYYIFDRYHSELLEEMIG